MSIGWQCSTTSLQTFHSSNRYLCKTLAQGDLSSRKTDHIQLAFEAQARGIDNRFDYEPMINAHPIPGCVPPLQIAGRAMQAPIWISSMTGGAQLAGSINKNLALACREFGLGMGLGSCRPLLESDEFVRDFAVRSHIGDQPLFANLGIAQVQELLRGNKVSLIRNMVERLEADGLIVHVNPLQEWLQPEGDIISVSPLETIRELLDLLNVPVMVKEVGQGFGPKSLEALAALPLEAIEFGAQGGTNFALLENLRRDAFHQEVYEPVTHIGHSPEEMTARAALLCSSERCDVKARAFIVSGGIRNFLDGYYHVQSIPWKTMYAQASAFLKYAMMGEKELMDFTASQIRGLELAYTFLSLKK